MMMDRQTLSECDHDESGYKETTVEGSEREDMLTCRRDAVSMNTRRIPFSAEITTSESVCINDYKIKLENTTESLTTYHQLSNAFSHLKNNQQDKSSSFFCPDDKCPYQCNIQSNPGYRQTNGDKQRKKNKTVFTFVRPSPSRRRSSSSSSLIHSTVSKTRKLANLAKTFKVSISDTRLEDLSLFTDFDIFRGDTTVTARPSRIFEGARFLFCNTRWTRSPIESFVVPKDSIYLDDDDMSDEQQNDIYSIHHTAQHEISHTLNVQSEKHSIAHSTDTTDILPTPQTDDTNAFPPFIPNAQNCDQDLHPFNTQDITSNQEMSSPKSLSKCLERQVAVEEDDSIGVIEREYVTFDDTNPRDHINRYSYLSETSQFDVKTADISLHNATCQRVYANNGMTSLEIQLDGQNESTDLRTTNSVPNVITTTADHEQPSQNARKKLNRVKLALATSHAGIFVTGDSIDDPSSDSPQQQSFDTCPSWMGSHEVSGSSYLTPHYQPSSTEMEFTITCQKQQGPSISMISTRQRSNSSEKDSDHSLSPNSKTSVYDSGFEASGRHSNALKSPSFRKMNLSSTDRSTDEELSISMKGSTRRRKIADLQSCRRSKVDLLSPTFYSRSADSNESSKLLRCHSNSSGDSGLDTPHSAESPRSRPRDRKYSNQSKMSSKSSIKSDHSKGSFLSFLSPKHLLSRNSSTAEVRSCGSKSSRKRLSDFPDDEKLLRVNVSGRTFKLHEYFTSAYPETLLGNFKRNLYFDKQKDEFFFDRDPDIFRHIWNFYYTGKLHFPKDECVNLFVDEIDFFGISEDYLCTCCWEDEYEPAKEKLEKIETEIKKQEEQQQKSKMRIPKEACFRKKVWMTIKHPVVSLPARVFYFISILAIFISTMANITETIPCASAGYICKKNNTRVYFYIDAACVSFFTIEYLIGLASAPRRLTFIRQFMSIIDLLAIIPFYCDLMIRLLFGPAAVSGIDFLEILRILRIVRIFKLLKHSHRLQALIQTFKNSTKELGLIVVIYLVLVTVFSSVIYYAEMQDNPKYSSIPQSMWYAVITTTTTGYGDIVPETILGKLVGCACCLLGVLIVALPVPILQIK